MMNTIDTYLTRWKVRPTKVQLLRFGVSLLLAILLWGWVTQLKDPFESRTIANVAVQSTDLPGDLQLVSAIPNVRVTFKGARSTVERVQVSELSVRLDTSEITGPGEYTVALIVEGIDVSSRSVEPKQLSIQVDERVSQLYPLRIDSKTTTDDVRTIGEITPAVSQVTVRGPKSLVGRVSEVILPVSIEQHTQAFDVSIEPYAIDSSGARITELEIAPETVSTHVEVVTRGREVSVIAVVTGVPADGFTVAQRRALPDTIVVDGAANVLDSLLFVNTQPVDITDSTKSISTQVGLADLPTGVTVLIPASGKVEVRVAIEDTSKSSQVLPDQTVTVNGLDAGLEANVTSGTVSIEVSASAETLRLMTAADIAVIVDLDGLGPGTYTLTPRITVPQGVTWLGSEPPTVVVEITQASDASPQALPSSTPVP